MIRLMIVDDQTAIREALEVMLGLNDDIIVVATAGNGRDAVVAARIHHPDVVLMDLNMPVMGGVEATAAIRGDNPGIGVVVLTTFGDDTSILAALRAGALGYLTKDSDHRRIAQAIRSAGLGQSVLDPEVQGRLLLLASAAPVPRPPDSGSSATALTQREQEILGLIGAGLLNRQIATRLSISEATVKTHINNLFTKADLHSRAAAVRYALTSPHVT